MEADSLLDFLKAPDIFDLDLIDNGHDYLWVTREDLRRLFRKYPILEFTERGEEPRNFYRELESRLDAWKNARFCLRSSVSDKEKDATKAFSKFYHQHFIKNKFQFLKWQTSEESKTGLLLNQYAFDELWALTQRLKLRPLTPAQEEDRQNLEQFVAPEIRHNLICMEWIEIAGHAFESGVRILDQDHDFDKDRETATKIVDERIAKGNWQGPGPYKSKFNGI